MASAKNAARQYKRQRDFVFRDPSDFLKVSRDQIFGADHVMGQVEEIVDYLSHFERYRNLPFSKGVIFWGPPRAGKTYLSRYIASASGAAFVDMRKFPVETKDGFHVWQPRDVRNLFTFCAERAKKEKRPIVIFADQFDDWMTVHAKDDALTQFETELDGFSVRSENVFVVVTSKTDPRKLSHSSLFMPGRIETVVALSYPDHAQKIKLVEGFLGSYPHDEGIDLASIVSIASSPSQAQLKSLVDQTYFAAVKEVMIKAAKKERHSREPKLTEERLLKTFVEQVLGEIDAPTGHELSAAEEKRVRVHELGHYIVGRALGLPARFVSMRPGLRSLGMTVEDDANYHIETVRMFTDQIAAIFGGVEAERLCGLSESLSDGSDMRAAAELTKLLVESGHCRKKSLQRYGRFALLRDDNDIIEGSFAFIEALEDDAALLVCREEQRARRILAFFGKAPIAKIEKVFAGKSEGVMLRKELDALLEPKLSAYHRKHKIRDSLACANGKKPE